MSEHLCNVCAEVYVGGKGGAKGLCGRCYQRQRRGAAAAATPQKRAGVQLHDHYIRFSMPSALAAKALRAAAREEKTLSAWLRTLVEGAVRARRGRP